MWQVADQQLESRLFLGTALYPSPETMVAAIQASGAQVVTVSLRRQSPESNGGADFWDMIQALDCHVLPNTAGCKSAKEAITLANMARELFGTTWIKLEVVGDDYNLQPDPFGLLEATQELISQGFEVFPYCTDDLVLCTKLAERGCRVVMPWGSPIGSGQGLLNPFNLRTIRKRLPEVTLLVDAGIGKPSDAAKAMEMGYDGVLLNSAVALADDPATMARAFAKAIEAGRLGFEAGLMAERDFASPSTPTLGTPFWHGA